MPHWTWLAAVFYLAVLCFVLALCIVSKRADEEAQRQHEDRGWPQ